jgi:crossover junction endodeoxyribonuclease RuvC
VLVPGALPLPQRLAFLLEGLTAILGQGGIQAVAVETAYCGRSPRSALALGLARGVALAAAARAGLPVFEYAPAEVKRAFTGSGRAEKAQMMRIARTLFGSAPRLSDEADALAVAVCHLARGDVRRMARPAVVPAGALQPGPRTSAPGLRPALRSSVRRFGGAS